MFQEIRPYQCPNCHSSYKHKHHWKYHMKYECGPPQFKCILCNFRTKRKSGLKSHMMFRHYSKEKPQDVDKLINMNE